MLNQQYVVSSCKRANVESSIAIGWNLSAYVYGRLMSYNKFKIQHTGQFLTCVTQINRNHVPQAMQCCINCLRCCAVEKCINFRMAGIVHACVLIWISQLQCKTH